MPSPPSPFGQPPPPPPGTPGAPPAPGLGPRTPQAWTPPQKTGGARRRNTGVIIGAVVLIALIRAGAGGLLFHSSVTLPATLGGQPQITTGAAAAKVTEFKQKMADADIKGGDGAAYGAGDVPTYFVLASPGDPDTAQEVFDSATSDASSAGLTVQTPTPQDRSGVSFLCGGISQGSTPTGAVCVWSDGTEGIVISPSNGVDQTASAAAEAKSAI